MVILIESANEDENGLLSCSECGTTGYQNLIKHIKCKHQMSPKDYLNKYPDDKLYTDDMQKKFSQGGYAANKAMRDKGLDFSERSRKARATELRNDPNAYVKRNRKLSSNPEFRERATQRIMNATRWHGDRYHFNGKAFRSTWEVKFAEWLDSLNIDYEYEGIKIQYYDPIKNAYRTYYPDFYFPDFNLCIEIKPKMYLENPSILAKRDACLKNGYKFKFITQDELSNLSTDLFNV